MQYQVFNFIIVFQVEDNRSIAFDPNLCVACPYEVAWRLDC
jgi:hypothetical protein